MARADEIPRDIHAVKGWNDVLREEDDYVVTRRRWLKSTGWDCPMPPPGKVGLALSGGGIRSATFSLGLMKSLSKSRLVHSIDYLSTVSGGGYAGAFYCSLFVPNSRRGAAPAPASDPDEEKGQATKLGPDVLGSKAGRQALAQLRQGGHYLAPNGTSDALFAAVIAVRNWFAVALVSGLALLGFFLLQNLLLGISRPPLLWLVGQLGLGEGVAPRPWVTTLTVLSLWPAACAWAYWFARSGHVPRSRIVRLFSIQSLIALALTSFFLWPDRSNEWPDYLRLWVPVVSALALMTYALAEFVCFCGDRLQGAWGRAADAVKALAEEDRVRNRLSRWLLSGVFALVAVGSIAALDALVDQIFIKDSGARKALLGTPEWMFAAVVGDKIFAFVLFAALLFILSRVALRREQVRGRANARLEWLYKPARRVLALAGGLGILTLILIFWSALARLVVLNLAAPGSTLERLVSALLAADGKPNQYPHVTLALLTVIVLGIAALLGQVDALLNRSSLAAFYSSRLRAAYLGATNSRRWRQPPADTTPAHKPTASPAVDQDDPNDEITLDAYYCKPLLAPLHLINVTINETTSKSSRVIQRDRKGKSMTVAPSGYLYPPNSAAEPLALLKRGNSEDLPLSSWVAISGAAFTTGAGSHTSLGTAMMASLTNMRLGYWWEHNRPAFWRWRSPSKLVQSYLLRELRAKYEGTAADRWYLSDGGHYENTGVYELVRRRIPFIIASDNGADPNYEFTDVVNLIRKLRIDFEAEVEFLNEQQLEDLFGGSPLREVFGTLEEIRTRGAESIRVPSTTSPQPRAGPYATLARIRYHAMEENTPPSTLLLIKPRIAGKELPDLLQYREVNAAFPQQPTTNQFFDEAQWESYYRLGQLIGDMIFDKGRFAKSEPASWQPWKLEPLPAEDSPGAAAERARVASPCAVEQAGPAAAGAADESAGAVYRRTSAGISSA